jgi:predicted TIM-barrel fold metal-dependent hydrolase
MESRPVTAPVVDRSIPFVDTHHHLYDLGRLNYPWLTEPGFPDQPIGDYRMIRSVIGLPSRLFREFYGAHVTKSVHVEAALESRDPVEETAWLDSVATQHGFPNALVVFCDLEDGSAEAVMERHLEASALTRSVRVRPHPEEPSSQFLRAYQALGRVGLSYELNVSPGRILSGRDCARRFPDVQVILGHAGYPLRRDRDYFETWKAEIAMLGECENVACKVSGLGMADHRWTIESIRPWVLHCIDVFGPDRIMFGTNWPVDILYATYLEQTDAYRTIVAEASFSRDEQAAMLSGNAERYYRVQERATPEPPQQPGPPPGADV